MKGATRSEQRRRLREFVEGRQAIAPHPALTFPARSEHRQARQWFLQIASDATISNTKSSTAQPCSNTLTSMSNIPRYPLNQSIPRTKVRRSNVSCAASSAPAVDNPARGHWKSMRSCRSTLSNKKNSSISQCVNDGTATLQNSIVDNNAGKNCWNNLGRLARTHCSDRQPFVREPPKWRRLTFDDSATRLTLVDGPDRQNIPIAD